MRFTLEKIKMLSGPSLFFYQPLNFRPQEGAVVRRPSREEGPITLENKAAILTGRVIDADTGQPLKADVGFINVQTRGGHSVVVDSGKFRELIPADTAIVVLVVEVGRDHAYWSPFTTKLSLQPGEIRDVEIPLGRRATSRDTSE